MNGYLDNEAALNDCIWQAVHAAPAVDLWTALSDPGIPLGNSSAGIDALLTSECLVDELFRYEPRSPDNPGQLLTRKDFAALPAAIRADMVWHRLFVTRTPLNDDTRGVLTALGLLQLDPNSRTLKVYRDIFAKFNPEEHWQRIMRTANLNAVVIPCDPLNTADAKLWAAKRPSRPGFLTALSLDALLAWETSRPLLTARGVLSVNITGKEKEMDKSALAAVAGFLGSWLEKTRALYFAAAWNRGFDLAAKKNPATKMLRKCILPFCSRHDVPLLLRFDDGGASFTDNQPPVFVPGAIAEMCIAYPRNKFILAAADSATQQEIFILARKFPQITALAGAGVQAAPTALAASIKTGLELLGDNFIPFHSAAAVPEQLLYKWAHARWVLGKTLQNHYRDLRRTGWRVTAEDIERDVAALFLGNVRRLIKQ